MGHGGEEIERALSARDVLNNEEMLGKEETGRSSKQCLQRPKWETPRAWWV